MAHEVMKESDWFKTKQKFILFAIYERIFLTFLKSNSIINLTAQSYSCKQIAAFSKKKLTSKCTANEHPRLLTSTDARHTKSLMRNRETKNSS